MRKWTISRCYWCKYHNSNLRLYPDLKVLGPARDTAEYAAWHVEPYSVPCHSRLAKCCWYIYDDLRISMRWLSWELLTVWGRIVHVELFIFRNPSWCRRPWCGLHRFSVLHTKCVCRAEIFQLTHEAECRWVSWHEELRSISTRLSSLVYSSLNNYSNGF